MGLIKDKRRIRELEAEVARLERALAASKRATKKAAAE